MATVLEPTQTSALPEEVGPPPTRRANILLVDDTKENLVALEAVLRPLKQNLVLAESGEEALKCLLKNDFAVILLDVKMPEIDGFETAAYIKQLERTRHIPIIFLTAMGNDETHVFRGYEVGAVDYVIKPFDPGVLRSKVAAFVELYQKTVDLHESEERFKRAFANAPIGVALVGMDGRFMMVNRALCEMTGYVDSQLSGTDLTGLCHPDHAEWDLAQMAKEFAEDKRSYHGERILRSAIGDDVHVMVSASFVPGLRETDPYFIFQITDVTERKRLESFRDRFVANAAHELRTPTTVIVGTTNLLSQGMKDLTEEEVLGCLEALKRQGARLSRMVTSLLDLARLEEGRIDVKVRTLPLRALVDQVVEMTRPPEGKKVGVRVNPSLLVQGDADILDRILANLLVNAYNYGGDNIIIEAKKNSDRAVISISDDGDGVPDNLVSRLFDPFARGATSSRVGGSGLGLSLVRGLSQALGGDAHYSPRKPHGARFVVELQLGEADE
jgi:PAS domain S-box-containing protein